MVFYATRTAWSLVFFHRPENTQGGELRLSELCFPQPFDRLFNMEFFAMKAPVKTIGKITRKALKNQAFSLKKHFTNQCLRWYNKSIAALREKRFWMPPERRPKLNKRPGSTEQKLRCGFGAKRSGKSLPPI